MYYYFVSKLNTYLLENLSPNQFTFGKHEITQVLDFMVGIF